MKDIRITRLRYIAAPSIEELLIVVNNLGFKIEIKGAPIRDKNGWVLFFVIPDNVPEFESMDLR